MTPARGARSRRAAPAGRGKAKTTAKVKARRTTRPAAVDRAPSGLSHERIRREALRLIDKDGTDEFSTRKLGRALGCEAMAIYWYYPSKEVLLDAVVDELMAGIGVAAGGEGDWVAAMRRVAHAYRDLARSHPRAFPLLATRRFATESTFAFLEALFALARREGVADRTTARMFRAVSSYCSGFALNELATRRTPSALGPAALAARFPHVAAVSAWLEPRHLDDAFGHGLEILLEALAASARPAKRRRPRAR